MNTQPPSHRVCPHCGKEWPRAIQKPRDLGLLHWRLSKLPADVELTEAVIDAERQHAKMTPERLATLRAPPFDIFWQRLADKRAAADVGVDLAAAMMGGIVEGLAPHTPTNDSRCVQ